MSETIPLYPDNGVADPWCVPMLSMNDMEGAAVARMTADERRKADDYFSTFAMPGPGCIRCGRAGTFMWGLAHGHGHCHSCGWPGVAYHFLEVGGRSDRLVMVLWVHPLYVSRRAPA